jgi:cyanophycinase
MNAAPKGILIPIGGNEDKTDTKKVLARLIIETNKPNPNICLITLASKEPEEVIEKYKTALEDLGASAFTAIHYNSHGEADTAEHLQKIEQCDAVMITGGDQLTLTSLLGGTEILRCMNSRYFQEPGFVIAGTSAGAAAMCGTMITGGLSTNAMLKGTLQFTCGLGIIGTDIFIDTHFIQRGRLGRIVQIVASNPGVIGLGLAEDTGVIYKNNELEVIGSGSLVILDGAQMSYTDLMDIESDIPITVHGLILHILGPGSKFSVITRKAQHQ